MTLPSLVGAVDGWCDNTVPDARWWRTTSGPWPATAWRPVPGSARLARYLKC